MKIYLSIVLNITFPGRPEVVLSKDVLWKSFEMVWRSHDVFTEGRDVFVKRRNVFDRRNVYHHLGHQPVLLHFDKYILALSTPLVLGAELLDGGVGQAGVGQAVDLLDHPGDGGQHAWHLAGEGAGGLEEDIQEGRHGETMLNR